MSTPFNSQGKNAPCIVEYKTTGAEATSLTCTPTLKFRLLNITAHAASSVATALVVTLDSAQGDVYDTVLSSDTSWTNLYKIGEDNEIFKQGDSIIVSCADAVVVKSVIVRIELL